MFRWDGTNTSGTLNNANRYLGRRPSKTASQTDIYSNVDLPKYSTKSGAYVALIDPTSGQVIRGKFTFTRRVLKDCPQGAFYFSVLNAADDMSLTALDIDAKGNVIFAGVVAGDVENREYQTSNKKLVGRKPAEGEPYFAMLDANLVRRTKWSIPTQRTAGATEGSAKYYQQFGGAGTVAGIVGGAYCPDDATSFGACTSALLINGRPTSQMGQFYTTANALQVWGENNKYGDACRYYGSDGGDCLKTDAYAALIAGPAQLGDLSVCNPVDFKEPPVMLLWARFANARKSIGVYFDSDTDRGETGKLTLGGVFDCSELMCANTTALLGTGCTAMFLDRRIARVNLGTGHRVTESSDGLADGALISIRGGVVYSERFRDQGQSSTASIMVTRREGERIAVNAVVDCPSVVSIPNFAGCDEGFLTISAARSTGRLGDLPLTYKWKLANVDEMRGLTTVTRAQVLRLDAWLQNRTSMSRFLNVPYSMLVAQDRSGCVDGSSACYGRLHQFSVTVYNKADHVYTGKSNDINAHVDTCSTNLFNVEQGLTVDWCLPVTPPYKTKGLAAVDACVQVLWTPNPQTPNPKHSTLHPKSLRLNP